jgi:phosphomannomutase
LANIFLFDVDGTLTPAKSKIDPKFAQAFLRWMADKEVYIVSGGSFVRIIDQLGVAIVDKTEGVFACMGNIFYQRREQINPSGMNEWQLVYENKFVPPKNLYRSLNSYVSKSDYHTKTGNHHEVRVGMLNFSIVGRNATMEQRHEYASYDAESGERERIAGKLRKKYPDMDFVIGGAVSLDIFNKGNDKSQIIHRYLKESLEHNTVHFVGDRVAFPGNDYALASKLQSTPNGYAYEVESWQDTAELLKTEPFA